MTTIPQALRTYFLADTAISALLAGRWYPLRRPQNPVDPTVTYQRISGVDVNSHSGYSGLTIRRYQLTIWDANYARGDQLAQLIKQRVRHYGPNKALFNGQLSGLRVDNIWLAGETEGAEPDTQANQNFVDFFVGYSETQP